MLQGVTEISITVYVVIAGNSKAKYVWSRCVETIVITIDFLLPIKKMPSEGN